MLSFFSSNSLIQDNYSQLILPHGYIIKNHFNIEILEQKVFHTDVSHLHFLDHQSSLCLRWFLFPQTLLDFDYFQRDLLESLSHSTEKCKKIRPKIEYLERKVPDSLLEILKPIFIFGSMAEEDFVMLIYRQDVIIQPLLRKG